MLECCDIPLEKIIANDHKPGGVCYLVEAMGVIA